MPRKHDAPESIQVQKFLSGLDYPAGKQDLLKTAKQHGADNAILEILEQIPDQEYTSPITVSREVGKFH
ncbi:MAG: DUF2795 domain-containing protein [Bacteroidota bacterium]